MKLFKFKNMAMMGALSLAGVGLIPNRQARVRHPLTNFIS
jgi:hypothetical protein